MSELVRDQETLDRDATFEQPLRRVHYEAGMMLGLEATRDEQDYHRRRLTRHQYWLHGYGTVAGMAVTLDPATSTTPTESITVRVVVSPGIGIDGLGREVVLTEPYCVNLGEWLEAQSDARLLEGYDSDADTLWLQVTVRQADCEVAAQPVLAQKLNASTDAVQPSRDEDSVRLEMAARLPPSDGGAYHPWAVHGPLSGDPPAELTQAEQDLIAAAGGETARQLGLQARLLYALGDEGLSLGSLVEGLDAAASILLARIAINVPDIENILVNPANISVNNLVRPFVMTAGYLAHLARTP
jgi:hypothetical protein